MATAPQVDVHDRVQAAGKQMLIYTFSLMKTGEIHDLNNEAWLRPTEKIVQALDTLLKVERQAVTMVIHEGIAQCNSHALWLDPSTNEQAQELEQWLARREAGGIIFAEKPTDDEVKRFFFHFARFRAPPEAGDQMNALAEHLAREGVQRMKLAPAPLRLDGVGQGVRGVAGLWYYSKGAAGMGELLRHAPVEVKSARRVAQELVDACAVEQDLLAAFPLLGSSEEPARRAMDLGVLVAATSRGLGLSAVQCADLTCTALLAGAGAAYENPDPGEFTVEEAAGVLAVRQLVEGSKFTVDLARRVAAGVESHLGPARTGPPYLAGAPPALPYSQMVALAALYLEMVRGTGRRPAMSPLRAGMELLQSPPPHIERALVQVFVATMGFMPVGTAVELMNGDLAVIADIDHLRGRTLYRKTPPPVCGPRKIYVERMRTDRGKVIPERKARVELGTASDQGEEWAVRRTLRSEGLRDLVVRALLRRPSTVVAQLGLR